VVRMNWVGWLLSRRTQEQRCDGDLGEGNGSGTAHHRLQVRVVYFRVGNDPGAIRPRYFGGLRVMRRAPG
jgi:hypothetical protein